jgi:hypothetical protein
MLVMRTRRSPAKVAMKRYRFIVFDEHRLVVESRDFPATGDETAIRLADGWRDSHAAEVWHGPKLIKSWRRRSGD